VARCRNLRRIHRYDTGGFLRPIVLTIVLHMQWIAHSGEPYRRSWDVVVVCLRNVREVHMIRSDQGSGRDRRARAWRRLDTVAYPGGESLQEGTYRPGVRTGIGLLLAGAERSLLGQRQRCGAVLRRCHDEAAHVRRLFQIADPERIGEAERLP